MNSDIKQYSNFQDGVSHSQTNNQQNITDTDTDTDTDKNIITAIGEANKNITQQHIDKFKPVLKEYVFGKYKYIFNLWRVIRITFFGDIIVQIHNYTDDYTIVQCYIKENELLGKDFRGTYICNSKSISM